MREALVRARVRGIAATVGGPRPLTRADVRRNIDWLFTDQPDLSDRQIAKLLGIANSTVSRRRQAVALPQGAEDASTGEKYVADVTAREAARRLFRALEKAEVHDGALTFALVGDRTGRQLADILFDAYGDEAGDRARTFSRWISEAIRILGDGV